MLLDCYWIFYCSCGNGVWKKEHLGEGEGLEWVGDKIVKYGESGKYGKLLENVKQIMAAHRP